MRKKLTLFPVFLSLCLTGCSFTTSIESLLKAPKLSEQQEKIYKALTNSVGSNIRLCYPKSGDNLSAFIISNFDDDEDVEALVFYQKNSTASGNRGNIRINILDQRDGEWISVFDRAADGNEIEKVEIASLGPLENTYILIGYSISEGAGRMLDVYRYFDSALSVVTTAGYNYFHADDYDNDSENEVFMIQTDTDGNESKLKASLSWFDAASLCHTNQVYLSSDATEYASVLCGRNEDDEITGIYIDEAVGTSNLQTEILTVSNKVLSALYPDPAETRRPQGMLSADVNGDKSIEIPVVTESFPGYDEIDPEKIDLTTWLSLSGSRLKEMSKGFLNINTGTALMLPDSWEGRVSCYKDTVREEYVFCRYDENKKNYRQDKLLQLSIGKSESEARELIDEGYTLVHESDGDFTLILVTDSDPKLGLSLEQVQENLYFIK